MASCAIHSRDPVERYGGREHRPRFVSDPPPADNALRRTDRVPTGARARTPVLSRASTSRHRPYPSAVRSVLLVHWRDDRTVYQPTTAMAAFRIAVAVCCFALFGSTFVSSDGAGGNPSKSAHLGGGDKGPIEGTQQTLKFRYW